MKNCKGFVSIDWLEKYCGDTRLKIWEQGTVAYIDMNNLLLSAKKNIVPLPEFEAYKQKTKQAIDKILKESLDLADFELSKEYDNEEIPLDILNKRILAIFKEKLKKELEL